MSAGIHISIQWPSTSFINPYHCEYKGDSLDWNWREVFMENNPVSMLVLKPYHIDSLLYDRVSI